MELRVILLPVAMNGFGRFLIINQKTVWQGSINLISYGSAEESMNGIVPVEVKSGDSSRLKSLQLFMQSSPSDIAIRFWGNFESKNKIKTPSGKEFTLFNLPYYYAGFIDKYLNERL